jgi:hypothetical protein
MRARRSDEGHHGLLRLMSSNPFEPRTFQRSRHYTREKPVMLAKSVMLAAAQKRDGDKIKVEHQRTVRDAIRKSGCCPLLEIGRGAWNWSKWMDLRRYGGAKPPAQ